MELYSIKTSPYSEEAAIIAARSAAGRWTSGREPRDYAIGATAISLGAILITKNLKDFDWIPKGKVRSPKEFVETYTLK